MRTFVASSLATTPAEAVLDVAERLRAQGFHSARVPQGFALCFVAHSLLDPRRDVDDHGGADDVPTAAAAGRRGVVDATRAAAGLAAGHDAARVGRHDAVHDRRHEGRHEGPHEGPRDGTHDSVHAALHAALGDLLGPLPFLACVGRSAFHDQRVPEGRPGLVVLVVAGATAEARHALLQEHAMQTAAPLLADGRYATTRVLAVSGTASTGSGSVLAEFDEAGGDVVGCAAGRPVRHLQPGVSSLAIDGVRLVTTTAHAARPLGPLRTITAATPTAIRELDGRPALEMLLADLPESLRSRLGGLGGALFCSFDVDDGDAAVVRGVTGVDPGSGAVVVAERPRVGTEVAFSLRDQGAARDDLEAALAGLEDALDGRAPLAFVVFSSTARDSSLFGAPLWDVTRVLSRFGHDAPVVGCTSRLEIARLGRRAVALSQSVVVAALLPERTAFGDAPAR